MDAFAHIALTVILASGVVCSSSEKLYHSYMVFRPGDQRVGALIKDRNYFVRVDAFNENGITEGTCIKQ